MPQDDVYDTMYEHQEYTGAAYIVDKAKIAKTKDRPELDKTLFKQVYDKLKKTNPALNIFFDVLSEPINAAILIKERFIKPSGSRSIMYAILSLQEIYYPDKTKGCNSELSCINDLLTDNNLVKKENVKAVLSSLSVFMDTVLFSAEQTRSEQTRRSDILRLLLDQYTWFSEKFKQTHVIATQIFAMNVEKVNVLNLSRRAKTLHRLTNVVEINEYVLLQVIIKLKAIVNEIIPILNYPDKQTKIRESRWLHAAIQLIQASIGSRWIEVCNMSEYTETQLKEINRITVSCFAKQTGYSKNNITTEEDDIDELDDNQQVNQGFMKLGVTKTILYDISAKRIIAIVAKIRLLLSIRLTQTTKKMPKTFKYRKIVHDKYFKGSVKFFGKLWQDQAMDDKSHKNAYLNIFRNKTHLWRKIYAYYSWMLWNPNGNLNAHIMRVLVHTSINTSFHYANVVIIPTVRVHEKADKEILDMFMIENELIKRESKKLSDKVQELQHNQKTIKDLTTQLNEATADQFVDLRTIDNQNIQMIKYDTKIFHKRFTLTTEKELFIKNAMNRIITDLNKLNVSMPGIVTLTELGIPKNIARLLQPT
jgi:hypothetical protein